MAIVASYDGKTADAGWHRSKPHTFSETQRANTAVMELVEPTSLRGGYAKFLGTLFVQEVMFMHVCMICFAFPTIFMYTYTKIIYT